MAKCKLDSDIVKLKNTKIPVDVIEVLQDLLVVSYVFGSKYFQGVLLDSNKSKLPCGINPATTQGDDEGDLLHRAITQRFTYFQNITPVNGVRKDLDGKKLKNCKAKDTRMTVRLRPRQVLCSNCKSICSESSENVDKSRKPRNEQSNLSDNLNNEQSDHCDNSNETDIAPIEPPPVVEKTPKQILPEITYGTYFLRNHTNKLMTTSLVPKLPRLQPNDITNAINGKLSPQLPVDLLNDDYCISSPTYPIIKSSKSARVSNSDRELCSTNSTGSIEESIPPNNNIENKYVCDIDIEGNAEDTTDDRMVLRKRHGIGSMEDLWDESVFEEKQLKSRTTPVLKISFGSQGQGTVLKIPSKIANNAGESDTDENIVEPNTTKAARKAHKRAKREAKRKLVSDNGDAPMPPSTPDIVSTRKKHKIKRKKKHRRQSVSGNDIDQKLSINFKHLGGNSYTAQCELPQDSSTHSDSSEEMIPDFPELSAAMQPVQTECAFCTTTAGKIIEIGDVIWGKVQGCPWWPGKILTFNGSARDQKVLYAHIAWFGSTTSSLINCDSLSPFLDSYKLRFNKHKKSGQYKEAIRQATHEARQQKNLQAGK